MTVREIVDSILQKNCGDNRLKETCDLLMMGDWNAEVTGIACTFIITPSVIREAAGKGCNFIITHEPTWFSGADGTDWCEEDPVYWAKRALLKEHQMNVWRFHDHMHIGKTDLIYDGLIRELGWEAYRFQAGQAPAEEGQAGDTAAEGLQAWGKGIAKWRYDVPETTLRGLVEELKQKLQMNTVRVVGDPKLRVNRVGILVGGGSLGLGVEHMPMEFMEKADVQVMLCGDITEWTLCSYVNDAAQMGFPKAMVVLGHERTEEAGMKYLAKWVQPLVPDAPVFFVDAKEPFLYL